VIKVHSADEALDILLHAMDKRWRVTVGFWEVKRDDNRRIIKDAHGREQYVHTVRTMEPFDIDGPTGQEYVTAMDALPRDGKGAAIRRFRVDRVTDITVHKRSPYRMPNAYFIGRVRAHAAEHEGEGWGRVAAMTDDALWSLIDEASSTQDAIDRATVYAEA
jgi:hypothetical protein